MPAHDIALAIGFETRQDFHLSITRFPISAFGTGTANFPAESSSVLRI